MEILHVTGECQHGIYRQEGDRCLGCGFCTIDGNDYSAMDTKQRPCKL